MMDYGAETSERQAGRGGYRCLAKNKSRLGFESRSANQLRPSDTFAGVRTPQILRVYVRLRDENNPRALQKRFRSS